MVLSTGAGPDPGPVGSCLRGAGDNRKSRWVSPSRSQGCISTDSPRSYLLVAVADGWAAGADASAVDPLVATGVPVDVALEVDVVRRRVD